MDARRLQVIAAAYLWLGVRVISWNIISLLGVGVILLTVASDQGQELLRLAADNPSPWSASWTLGAAILLFFCTTVSVAAVTATAGAHQLQVRHRQVLASCKVTSSTNYVIPSAIGAVAAASITASIHELAWLIVCGVVAAMGYALAYRLNCGALLTRVISWWTGWIGAFTFLGLSGIWALSLVLHPAYARDVGTLVVAIVSVTLWVNIFSLLFVAGPLRYRFPSLVLLIPVLWVGSSFFHDTNLWPRRDSDELSPWSSPKRRDVPQSVPLALASWILQFEHDDHEDSIPVYLVSAEGGGIRAAYWTARVLAELQERTVGRFAPHVFVYSGVSGGSLGIAAFQNASSDPASDPRDVVRFVDDFLGRDYLAPLVSRLMVTEPLWQLLGHASGVLPRDVAFERQLNTDWKQISGSNFFSQPFNAVYSVDAKRPMSIMAFNSTNVESGKRLVIANATPSGLNTDYLLPMQIDGVRELLSDVTVAEVVHLSARFPYISPPASLQVLVPGTSPHEEVLRRWGRAVDGGYFDNSAGLFVHDVYEELVQLRSYARRRQGVSEVGLDWERIRPLVSRLRFHVLVIRNDPNASSGRQMNDYPSLDSVTTRGLLPFDFDGAMKDGLSPGLFPGAAPLSELLAPPETMLTTRDARGAATRRSLWETVSRTSDDLSYQCEIERRVANGQPITLPLQYSSPCVEDVDDYQEISLADASLENHDEAHYPPLCGSFQVQAIALGWTLSRESRELMSCLAHANQSIRDIASTLIQPATASSFPSAQSLRAALPP